MKTSECTLRLLGLYTVTFHTDGDDRFVQLVARNYHHAIRLARKVQLNWEDHLKYELISIHYKFPVIFD